MLEAQEVVVEMVLDESTQPDQDQINEKDEFQEAQSDLSSLVDVRAATLAVQVVADGELPLEEKDASHEHRSSYHTM